MTDLSALIARVEEGTGPDRELDLAIIKAIYPFALVSRYNSDTKTNEPYTYHNPTDSLDSVATLIERKLPGAAYVINVFDVQRKPERIIAAKAHISDYDDNPSAIGRRGALGTAASPARALLAATLRALSALEGSKADLADATNGDRP